MRRIRVIPVLLLKDNGLVKTIRFKDPTYLGDPINAVKIFNEKEVDELALLDIGATVEKRAPNFDRIREIASESFMPMAYGGGITTIDQIQAILKVGLEKVIINTAAVENPALISEAARLFGSQSIVASIDVKRTLFGGNRVFTAGGTVNASISPEAHAQNMEKAGAGEILLNSIDRDGTYQGYDLELIRTVSAAVNVPVVACGGARNVDDFAAAVNQSRASAVAAGSMFVYHGKQRGVLINFPREEELQARLFSKTK